MVRPAISADIGRRAPTRASKGGQREGMTVALLDANDRKLGGAWLPGKKPWKPQRQAPTTPNAKAYPQRKDDLQGRKRGTSIRDALPRTPPPCSGRIRIQSRTPSQEPLNPGPTTQGQPALTARPRTRRRRSSQQEGRGRARTTKGGPAGGPSQPFPHNLRTRWISPWLKELGRRAAHRRVYTNAFPEAGTGNRQRLNVIGNK